MRTNVCLTFIFRHLSLFVFQTESVKLKQTISVQLVEMVSTPFLKHYYRQDRSQRIHSKYKPNTLKYSRKFWLRTSENAFFLSPYNYPIFVGTLQFHLTQHFSLNQSDYSFFGSRKNYNTWEYITNSNVNEWKKKE